MYITRLSAIFLLLFCGYLNAQIGVTKNSDSKLPAETYYKSFIFGNKTFGYKNQKVILPEKGNGQCVPTVEGKSYRCQGSKIIRLKNIGNSKDENFEVSATNTDDDKNSHVYTIIKNSLIKTQNNCYYESEFLPLKKKQYYNIKKLNCNALTKEICQIVYDVYHNPNVDNKEAKIDPKLYKSFIDTLKSEKYQTAQKEISQKSYNSIFHSLNSLYGENSPATHNYPKGLDNLENSISATTYPTEYSSLLDMIEGKEIETFKELEIFLRKSTGEIGYFHNNFVTKSYGLIGTNFFTD